MKILERILLTAFLAFTPNASFFRTCTQLAGCLDRDGIEPDGGAAPADPVDAGISDMTDGVTVGWTQFDGTNRPTQALSMQLVYGRPEQAAILCSDAFYYHVDGNGEIDRVQTARPSELPEPPRTRELDSDGAEQADPWAPVEVPVRALDGTDHSVALPPDPWRDGHSVVTLKREIAAQLGVPEIWQRLLHPTSGAELTADTSLYGATLAGIDSAQPLQLVVDQFPVYLTREASSDFKERVEGMRHEAGCRMASRHGCRTGQPLEVTASRRAAEKEVPPGQPLPADPHAPVRARYAPGRRGQPSGPEGWVYDILYLVLADPARGTEGLEFTVTIRDGWIEAGTLHDWAQRGHDYWRRLGWEDKWSRSQAQYVYRKEDSGGDWQTKISGDTSGTTTWKFSGSEFSLASGPSSGAEECASGIPAQLARDAFGVERYLARIWLLPEYTALVRIETSLSDSKAAGTSPDSKPAGTSPNRSDCDKAGKSE